MPWALAAILLPAPQGVVTKIIWSRPHPYIFLDVRDAGGQITNWLVEGSNIRLLEQLVGWTATTVKPGDTISVCGYLGRKNPSPGAFPDGVSSERAMAATLVTLADGRRLPFLQADKTSCP